MCEFIEMFDANSEEVFGTNGGSSESLGIRGIRISREFGKDLFITRYYCDREKSAGLETVSVLKRKREGRVL